MRGPVREFVEADHDRLEQWLAAACSSGEIDVAACQLFRGGLLRHIGMEEKVRRGSGRADSERCYHGSMTEVTRIVDQLRQGDSSASEQLLQVVYAELRKLATDKLAHERPGQTLQATALVHEAYLRLVDGEIAPHWNGRGHFFAAAAEAMRRILVENARRKGRQKHGGEHQKVELESDVADPQAPSLDLLALDEAMSRLAASEPVKAELVKLRFFAGLSMPEAAAALDISLATAERHWTFARSWLYAELSDHR